jgi:phospholipid/cholesterol/gamma-HCH transport system permease protein
MFTSLGFRVIYFFENLGGMTLLTGRLMLGIFKAKRLIARTLDQMWRLGVGSLGVTGTTAIFVGMAFTIQVTREFLKFGAGKMIGGVVGLAVWRELGPLLTGVVLAGRVGAAISAELGTMKVTEQVEALEAMSHDPVDFLVLPRVLACTIMTPLLVGLADILGFLSGFLIAISSDKVNPYAYFDSADSMLKIGDITGGLIKAALFGFIIGLVSTYMGLKANGGAKGVGEMTTKAVVTSLILIFILNYFLSLTLF